GSANTKSKRPPVSTNRPNPAGSVILRISINPLPSFAAFASIVSNACGFPSTATARKAPRPMLSSATAPLPAKRSRRRAPSRRTPQIENSASRTRPSLGRASRGAGSETGFELDEELAQIVLEDVHRERLIDRAQLDAFAVVGQVLDLEQDAVGAAQAVETGGLVAFGETLVSFEESHFRGNALGHRDDAREGERQGVFFAEVQLLHRPAGDREVEGAAGNPGSGEGLRQIADLGEVFFFEPMDGPVQAVGSQLREAHPFAPGGA